MKNTHSPDYVHSENSLFGNTTPGDLTPEELTSKELAPEESTPKNVISPSLDDTVSMLLANDVTIVDDAIVSRMIACFMPDGKTWNETEWKEFVIAYNAAYASGDWSSDLFDVARDSWLHWYFIMRGSNEVRVPDSLSFSEMKGILLAKAMGFSS